MESPVRRLSTVLRCQNFKALTEVDQNTDKKAKKFVRPQTESAQKSGKKVTMEKSGIKNENIKTESDQMDEK